MEAKAAEQATAAAEKAAAMLYGKVGKPSTSSGNHPAAKQTVVEKAAAEKASKAQAKAEAKAAKEAAAVEAKAAEQATAAAEKAAAMLYGKVGKPSTSSGNHPMSG